MLKLKIFCIIYLFVITSYLVIYLSLNNKFNASPNYISTITKDTSTEPNHAKNIVLKYFKKDKLVVINATEAVMSDTYDNNFFSYFIKVTRPIFTYYKSNKLQGDFIYSANYADIDLKKKILLLTDDVYITNNDNINIYTNIVRIDLDENKLETLSPTIIYYNELVLHAPKVTFENDVLEFLDTPSLYF